MSEMCHALSVHIPASLSYQVSIWMPRFAVLPKGGCLITLRFECYFRVSRSIPSRQGLLRITRNIHCCLANHHPHHHLSPQSPCIVCANPCIEKVRFGAKDKIQLVEFSVLMKSLNCLARIGKVHRNKRLT